MKAIHCPSCKTKVPFLRFLIITWWSPYRCLQCGVVANINFASALAVSAIITPAAFATHFAIGSINSVLGVRSVYIFASALAIFMFSVMYWLLRLVPKDSRQTSMKD